ncbi:MAG: GNAT family N-acetyltransferase, partial [Bacteroidota bacterium]
MSFPIVVNPSIQLLSPQAVPPSKLFQLVDQQRDHLRQWLPWVDQTTEEAHSERFLKESHLFNVGGQRLTTFISFQNQLVGAVSLVRIDKHNKLAEIGYWIDREQQGQGIVTRSCQALIRHVFTHKDLNRLEIRMATGNTRSRKIPLKLGFSHELKLRQALRIHDTYHDLEVFA